RRFIAFQRGVILVLRAEAVPFAPVVDLAVWAVSAAWMRSKKAAMVMGLALNVAIAARIAVYMILARLMTPVDSFLDVSREALGGALASEVPMMFLPCAWLTSRGRRPRALGEARAHA